MQPVPTNLNELLQLVGLPLPTATDDNGMPYWIVEGSRINWAQMEQVLWTKLENMKRQGSSGGHSMEMLPVIPDMPSDPEKGVEAKYETRVEQRVEQEAGAERLAQGDAQPTSAASTSTSSHKSSYVGEGPTLKKVDTADPGSMKQFTEENKDAPPTSSNRFLAEMLTKILRILSLQS